MQRRSFVTSALAGSMLAPGAVYLPRRRYRDNIELSIIGFGGIVVVGLDQGEANRTVAEAFDRGVNYFDVAPTYGNGEAEEKLGPALQPYRKRSFLACKTTVRDAAGARAELERSLQRMRTDHFDLYQFHAVSKLEDVNRIIAPGGAGELFLKARSEGKTRYLGCSAHSAEAALALMDRFPLDSILFPVNFVCWAQGGFGPQILARAREKGIARLALKAMAYTTVERGAAKKYPKCWYEPVEGPQMTEQALRFTLSEDVTAAIPPGDERLFRRALDIAVRFRPLSAEERSDLLAGTKGVAPIFRA